MRAISPSYKNPKVRAGREKEIERENEERAEKRKGKRDFGGRLS